MIEYRGEKFSGFNKPKLTPKHPTKKAVVLARFKKNGKTVVRMIRFGFQGMGHNFSEDARRRFKSRCYAFCFCVSKEFNYKPWVSCCIVRIL